MGSRISKEAEERILAGLVKVADLVNGGAKPNDAIVKVGREDKLPPGHLRLMVNAYNTGRTNRQRSSAEDVLDKAAEFDMADASAIVEAIYPRHVKTAAEASREADVSDEYDAPPSWLAERRLREKVAAAAAAPLFDEDAPAPYGRDPDRFLGRADGLLDRLRREREDLYGRLQHAHDKVAAAVGDLCLYFRRPGCTPLEDVRANAEAFFGPAAGLLLDKVAEMSATCMASKPLKVVKKKPKVTRPEAVTVKRSSALPPMERGKTPYLEVEQVLVGCREHRELFDKVAAFEKVSVAAELELNRALAGGDAAPLPADPTISVLRRARGEKRAFMGGAMGTMATGAQFALGSEAGKSIMKKLSPDPDDKVKQDAVMSMLDPSHEARLRSIRAQATLHSLLNSPYFEGEDPNHVTDLFNKVTKLSPRMAEQPILLEAAMRRLMAQGAADPHDLDQLLGMEVKQKQRDALPAGAEGVVGMTAPGLAPKKPAPEAKE